MRKQIEEAIKNVTYKPGWSFIVNQAGCQSYVQVQLPSEGAAIPWRGRKWLLSDHMTEGEVVQTCLMAVLAAEEHEAREAFEYKGKAIFGPHLSMDQLLTIADETEFRAPYPVA